MMDLGIIINQLIWGVLIGVSYSLLAIAFSLIFAAAGTINFANGECAMVGAYFCFTALSKLSGNIMIAICVALVGCFILGAIIERLAFRRLYKLDPVLIVIATIGISTLLKNLVLIIWGPFSQTMPSLISAEPIRVGSIILVPQNLILLGVGILVMIAFHLFMTQTKLGTAMRATAQNPKAASLSGINTRRTVNLTWALGFLVAAIAGVMIAFIYNLSIEMGGLIGIKGFASAILGGFGNIVGAMFGGVLLGVTENMGAMVVDYKYKDLIAFAILILILLVKPTGLFVKGKSFRRI